jgi:hypothetical protein
MDGDAGFETLCDVPLELDEAAVERGEDVIIGDADVRLLHDNRIALAKGRTTRLSPTGAADGRAYYDVPLMCVVHSHPECRFRWARLVVDLAPTPEARIRDMSPREVRGDTPVEIETTVSLGLKFQLVEKGPGVDVSPEFTRKRTAYFPQIISSGVGFRKGYWDFLALADEYLHADRELRLLVEAPADRPVDARFDLRAKVRLAGIAGLIPLLARTGAVRETYRLS